jgi:hypothetical protein
MQLLVYYVIVVTCSEIAFNYMLVNLKIVCPNITLNIVNGYGKDDRLLIPRKGNRFYHLLHVYNVSVSSLSPHFQFIQIVLSLGLMLHPMPMLSICGTVSPATPSFVLKTK